MIGEVQFETVPHIYLKYGAARDLGNILRTKFNASSVLIITDKGVLDAGLLEHALTSLNEAGLHISVFSDVIADPPEHLVLDMASRAKDAGDVIIGFGGGSSLDTAKLIAVLADEAQPISSMYGIGNVNAPRRPLVHIPTTAGTGSEVTPIAIVTTGETTKSGIVSSVLYADMAILDAELTMSLPPHVTAATGIDAMVHAIEAYTSRHKKNPISDMFALKALNLLNDALPRAVENGTNQEAREAALLGSMYAGQAFANAPVAAVHALAYPLGGIYHLPHGLSNALVLPHVLEFNSTHAAPLYAELYTQLTGDIEGDDHQKADKFTTHMTALCEKVQMRKPLREFNISHNALTTLAEDAMKQTRLLGNNPRPVTYEDALRIYEQAW